MTAFVWTKMGVESGDELEKIARDKETQRISGKGIFWWGIGNSLGAAVRERARAQGGTLPVLFSRMLVSPKLQDSAPDMVWKWTAWEDESGQIHDIPPYVKVISRGATSKERHYALVCCSNAPLTLGVGIEKFDPKQCLTLAGKVPGSSQVTALLTGSPAGHLNGPYEICFRAALVKPWAVKLVKPIPN